MQFTFGICVGKISYSEAEDIYCSILSSFNLRDAADKFEVLYIGGLENRPSGFQRERAKWIDFDETQKSKAWITRKKNIIAQEAKYENIVFMHDYFRLATGWYTGWEMFGNEFEVACNQILTVEGYRHSDWVVDPYLLWEKIPSLKDKFWDVSLEYYENYTSIQYISGGYWVAKKQFMLDNPLDESLVWGDAEDIEWSRRIRTKTEFRFNRNSVVYITKPGKWAPGIIPNEYLAKML